MVLDSSAIIAILFDEPERDGFIAALERDELRLVGAPTLLEVALVLSMRKGDGALPQLDAMLVSSNVEVVPFGTAEAFVARRAHLAYGKGRHPARLNFGDCMAYAMAKTRGEPLLYKGDDFALTDIASAL